MRKGRESSQVETNNGHNDDDESATAENSGENEQDAPRIFRDVRALDGLAAGDAMVASFARVRREIYKKTADVDFGTSYFNNNNRRDQQGTKVNRYVIC